MGNLKLMNKMRMRTLNKMVIIKFEIVGEQTSSHSSIDIQAYLKKRDQIPSNDEDDDQDLDDDEEVDSDDVSGSENSKSPQKKRQPP